MKKKTIVAITLICLVTISFFLLNMEVSTKQGVNYTRYTKKIPLYFKALAFVYRHFAYKQLIKEIIKDNQSDKEKVLAIFKWTHENIREIPAGLPVVDDHILNIIIRGYGGNDQSQDVFCMFCEYAGIPAAWVFISPEQNDSVIAVAIVKLEGEWRLFDTYFGNYFINENGEFATVDEIIANPDLIEQAKHKPVIKGVEYKSYFAGLRYISDKDLWKRGKTQMPMYRLMFEAKKLIKILKRKGNI